MTTSLHDYASRGKLDKIIEKVGKGRNLDRQEPTYDNTVLGIASACNHLPVVEWCISRGVKLNTREVHGWTALHLAALKGHVAVAERLVAAGIDVNVLDLEGKTARQLAESPPDWVPVETEAVEGRAKIVALLTR